MWHPPFTLYGQVSRASAAAAMVRWVDSAPVVAGVGAAGALLATSRRFAVGCSSISLRLVWLLLLLLGPLRCLGGVLVPSLLGPLRCLGGVLVPSLLGPLPPPLPPPVAVTAAAKVANSGDCTCTGVWDWDCGCSGGSAAPWLGTAAANCKTESPTRTELVEVVLTPVLVLVLVLDFVYTSAIDGQNVLLSLSAPNPPCLPVSPQSKSPRLLLLLLLFVLELELELEGNCKHARMYCVASSSQPRSQAIAAAKSSSGTHTGITKNTQPARTGPTSFPKISNKNNA
jgi:hypothetical protein